MVVEMIESHRMQSTREQYGFEGDAAYQLKAVMWDDQRLLGVFAHESDESLDSQTC